MTNDEYNQVYRDALKTLAHTHQVAEPFVQADGSRICQVGDRLLSEDEVLERCWGKRLAAIIQSDRWARYPVALHESGMSKRSSLPARLD